MNYATRRKVELQAPWISDAPRPLTQYLDHQAVAWITSQGLTIVDEAFRWENGWGYRHFLLHTGK